MYTFHPLSSTSAPYKPELWYQHATCLPPFHRVTHIPEELQAELAWLPGLTLRATCQPPACASHILLPAWSSLHAHPGPGKHGILRKAGSRIDLKPCRCPSSTEHLEGSRSSSKWLVGPGWQRRPSRSLADIHLLALPSQEKGGASPRQQY